jgi:hypothetical protein
MIYILAGKPELNLFDRVKQVLFRDKFNKTFRINASWCGIKTFLIRLGYDKRFGGKTELNLNRTRVKQELFWANLMKLLG